MVALGRRHHLLWQNGDEYCACQYRHDSRAHYAVRLAETEVDESVEIFLHQIEEGEARLTVLAYPLTDRLADKVELQEGCNKFGHEERHQEDYRDAPREEQEEVVVHARHRQQ